MNRDTKELVEGTFDKPDINLIDNLSKPLTQDELNITDSAIKLVKNTNNKKTIYEHLDQWGQIRCRDHWALYREIFFSVLEKKWNQTPENYRLIDYDFYKNIYTTVNDALVILLKGNSFTFTINLRKDRNIPI